MAIDRTGALRRLLEAPETSHEVVRNDLADSESEDAIREVENWVPVNEFCRRERRQRRRRERAGGTRGARDRDRTAVSWCQLPTAARARQKHEKSLVAMKRRHEITRCYYTALVRKFEDYTNDQSNRMDGVRANVKNRCMLHVHVFLPSYKEV